MLVVALTSFLILAVGNGLIAAEPAPPATPATVAPQPETLGEAF